MPADLNNIKAFIRGGLTAELAVRQSALESEIRQNTQPAELEALVGNDVVLTVADELDKVEERQNAGWHDYGCRHRRA